jgi:hypothetical protein
MKAAHYRSFHILLSILAWITASHAQATLYISSLDVPWTSGGIGDIETLFPGHSFGTIFTTGSGSSFTLTSATFEFYGGWNGLSVQCYEYFGGDSYNFIGQLGTPTVDPKQTQWPGSTTYVDFHPASAITLNPSTSYLITAGLPTSGFGPVNLLFTGNFRYATPTDWTAGFTRAGTFDGMIHNMTLNFLPLTKFGIDATAVPEPDVAGLLLGGCVLLRLRRSQKKKNGAHDRT